MSYSILFDSCQRGNNEDLNLLWFLIAAAVQQNQLCGVILVNLFDFFVVNFCLNYGNYIIVLILNVPFFEVNFLELIYTAMHLFTFCYLTEININLYETLLPGCLLTTL